jgi:hypothetical protein
MSIDAAMDVDRSIKPAIDARTPSMAIPFDVVRSRSPSPPPPRRRAPALDG